MNTSSFLGWRVLEAYGPLQPSFLPHTGRPLLLTGPNGTGKSTLLAAITSGSQVVQLEYSGVPRRFAPHLALIRELFEEVQDRTIESAATSFRGQRDLDSTLLRISPSGDDFDWLTEHLGQGVRTGVTNVAVRWFVGSPDGDAGQDVIELPLGRRSVTEPMQRWVVPSDADVDVVANRTGEAFQTWVTDLATASGAVVTSARNPLVVRVGDNEVSVLQLANIWADRVSERSAARFREATGLDCRLGCHPADEFRWRWREVRSWLAPGELSTGLKRWFALSVLETLREYESLLKSPSEASDFSDLLADPPDWAFPTAPVEVFAGEPFWLAVDEPELHLYPTEENHLADALARQASAGRMLVATHSLQLASAFMGSADFVTFTDRGRFVVHEPTGMIEEALGVLARHSPAIVSRFSVLYVEGEWDQRVIEALFGSELSRGRVLLSPLHGVNDSDRIVGSVWSRMLGLPIWILFDRLTQDEVVKEWDAVMAALNDAALDRATLAARLRSRADEDGPNEQRALMAMLGMIVNQHLEGSVRFLCHGLSDILQVVHPRRFFIDAESWDEAGYVPSDSFKTWLVRRTGRDIERASWYAWRNAEAEPWDDSSVAVLRQALDPILR